MASQKVFMVPCQTPVIRCHQLPATGRVSLYNYVLDESDGIIFLNSMIDSWWRMAPSPELDLLPGLVELLPTLPSGKLTVFY